jgi:hypothetical protein
VSVRVWKWEFVRKIVSVCVCLREWVCVWVCVRSMVRGKNCKPCMCICVFLNENWWKIVCICLSVPGLESVDNILFVSTYFLCVCVYVCVCVCVCGCVCVYVVCVIERDRDEEMGFLLGNNCESENEKRCWDIGEGGERVLRCGNKLTELIKGKRWLW